MKTVCCIGHRGAKTNQIEALYLLMETLIKEGVTKFIFGSRSKFNDCCLDVALNLKQNYNDLKLVYIRAEYPYINKDYYQFLLEKYDETYFPQDLIGARKNIYIKRNEIMIDESDAVLINFNENVHYTSGTSQAFKYACLKNKKIIRFN